MTKPARRGVVRARVAFSRDGSLLAAVGRTGSIALWDAGTRRLVGRPLAGHFPDARAAVLPDKDTLVSAVGNGLVLWDLRPSALVDKACAAAGRNLTSAEWSQFVRGDYQRTCPQWPPG